MGGRQLDQLSRAIIAELERDGRRSYAALGKAVGLSEAAVRQRVQRLTDAGLLRVVAVTDPARLGLHRQATIGVTVTGPVAPVADALAALAEVRSVVVTAGAYDLLAEVATADDDRLLELVTAVRALAGVLRTETLVHLDRR